MQKKLLRALTRRKRIFEINRLRETDLSDLSDSCRINFLLTTDLTDNTDVNHERKRDLRSLLSFAKKIRRICAICVRKKIKETDLSDLSV